MEKKVGLMSYRLKLSLSIKRLYLVFYIVKLTITSKDPIPGQYTLLLSDSIVVDQKVK